MRHFWMMLVVFFLFYSCEKEVKINFKEQKIERFENASIHIIYPEAIGTEKVADRMNKSIGNYIAKEMSLEEAVSKNIGIKKAIKNFDAEYLKFQNDFPDETQQWEVSVESEVLYENENIVCIGVNTYMDTGGAHGNSKVSFLNLDRTTGEILSKNDIVKDEDGLRKIALDYFKKEINPLGNNADVEDAFFGEDFTLPENVGFSEEGLILVYNEYEVAAYNQGVTEFVIPYAEAKPYLKVY